MPLSRQRRGRSGRRVARTVEPARPTRRRPTNKFYLLASVVIAVLVIASFAFASFSGGQGGGSGPASAYVDGVGVEQEIMASKLHIPDGEFAEYNTVPATSGDHWVLPQACGFYEEALPDERTTHNLEHGNIVVSYNLLSSEEVEELKGVMDDIGLARLWGRHPRLSQDRARAGCPGRLGRVGRDGRHRQGPHREVLRNLRRSIGPGGRLGLQRYHGSPLPIVVYDFSGQDIRDPQTGR